jgi:hypothetical protein
MEVARETPMSDWPTEFTIIFWILVGACAIGFIICLLGAHIKPENDETEMVKRIFDEQIKSGKVDEEL